MIKNTKKSKNDTVKNGAAKPQATTSVAAPIAARTPAPAARTAAPAPTSVVAKAVVAQRAPVAAKPVAAAPPVAGTTPKPAAPKVGHVSLELVKPDAKKVCVAGSFNGWTPEKAPLIQMGNGRWVGDLAVKPGKHEYLFVVDGQWLPDPNAKETVQNPFGGRNSVLTVSE